MGDTIEGTYIIDESINNLGNALFVNMDINNRESTSPSFPWLTDLYANYKYDDVPFVNGETVLDSSVNLRHLTVYSPAPGISDVVGKFGRAMFVEAGSPPSEARIFSISLEIPFSFSLWINLTGGAGDPDAVSYTHLTLPTTPYV